MKSTRRNAWIVIAVASPLLLLASAPASADERVCRGTLRAKTFDDVRVPPNANCVLIRARVKGNIKVQSNATLRAEDVVVIGNVQAENAKNVRVLDGSRIGGADIRRNTVEGNLQCKTNMPAPVGGNNVVNGNKEDQCRRL